MGQVVGPFTWADLKGRGLCLKQGDDLLCIQPRRHPGPHMFGIVRLGGKIGPDGTFAHRYAISTHPKARAIWVSYWETNGSDGNGASEDAVEGHPGR